MNARFWSMAWRTNLGTFGKELKPWFRIPLTLSILTALAFASRAQTTLNVTDFGAKGDAVQFYVNTVSNSTLITTTNVLSTLDIGKTIEIFGAGNGTYGVNSAGVTTNGWQDFIGIITDVLNSTNLYVKAVGAATNLPPQQTMTKARATYGTDNTPAFSKAIASAPTNAIVYVPNGTYLLMPAFRYAPNAGYAYAAIIIDRGGLHFWGQSRDQTVLLSRGAWQLKNTQDGTPWDGVAFRSFLLECVAPVTNDYPLIFENLTLDGGVPQGNLTVHGITANKVDGLGWDEQHSAYLTCDMVNGGGTASRQIFTNVNVVHWRGEAFKSIDQNTNGTIDIQNCLFGDICATALNIYPRWNIRGNVFSNCWQITEYYQKFYCGAAYFCNNLITNDASATNMNFGNAISINGGFWSASPLIIQSNTIYNGAVGMNIFITTPAANVSFLDNVIHAENYSTVFSIGAPGAQGTDCNSNILISGNQVYAPSKLTSFCGLGGWSGLYAAVNITICSNYVTAPDQIFYLFQVGPYANNISIHDNIFVSAMSETQMGLSGSGNSPFVLLQTNNIYTARGKYLDTPQTNQISYSTGFKQFMDYVATGNTFILNDNESSQIPAGACFEFDNRSNRWASLNAGRGGGNGDIVVYQSENLSLGAVPINFGQLVRFYWSGTAWTTNAPIPPQSFGNTPPAYVLTVNYGSGSGSYTNGQMVTVMANVISGKTFTKWTGATNILANPSSTSTIVIMPAQDASITANYLPIPPKPVVISTN